MSEHVSDLVGDETAHKAGDAGSRSALRLLALVGATVVVTAIILSLMPHGQIDLPSGIAVSKEIADRSRDETRHEPSDVSPRLVLALLALVASTVVVSVVILSLVYSGPINPPSTAPHAVPPMPRLQVDEPADLRQFRAQIDKQLKSYGWVDRQRGLVHIPIAEAMQRAAAQGFADWPGNRR